VVNPAQRPYGYYYAPLPEGGPYQKMLSEAGDQIGRFIGEMASVRLGKEYGTAEVGTMAGIIANIGGKVGAEAGGTVGWYIDNFSNIEQNLGTMMEQLNDPNFWIVDPFF
jgi:hypothetical protein